MARGLRPKRGYGNQYYLSESQAHGAGMVSTWHNTPSGNAADPGSIPGSSTEPRIPRGSSEKEASMMTMTTYPTTPERPVSRAEIDRLTAIIAQLNDALDAATYREDRLRHDVELQQARAEVAEALLAGKPPDPGSCHEWVLEEIDVH